MGQKSMKLEWNSKRPQPLCHYEWMKGFLILVMDSVGPGVDPKSSVGRHRELQKAK